MGAPRRLARDSALTKMYDSSNERLVEVLQEVRLVNDIALNCHPGEGNLGLERILRPVMKA